MDLGAALHQPRIDVAGADTVVVDETLPSEVIDALRAAHPVIPARRTVFPYAFACPAAVMRRGETNTGCTETMSPWGDAINESETRG
jgi:gamma-glutamyltranspeptidase/glutathione hydrolase